MLYMSYAPAYSSAMPERVYRPIPEFSREQIDAALANDVKTLVFIAFSVAVYGSNWKYAQDLCVRLGEHPDPRVRENAVLALAYIARFQGRLEKHIAKPVLLRAQRDEVAEVRGRAADAVDDINQLLRWRIGERPSRGAE